LSPCDILSPCVRSLLSCYSPNFCPRGRDEVDGYFARTDAITLDQANATIKKYYRTDDLTFVVLGAEDKIREQMKKYDPPFSEVPAKTPGWGN